MSGGTKTDGIPPESGSMVALTVEVPVEIFRQLQIRAEQSGMPLEAMVSLWMWRAVNEF